MVDLKYIGHSAFEFKTGETSILVDPLVSVNPKYDYTKSNITDIFITHAHSDHVGEAQEYCTKPSIQNIQRNLQTEYRTLADWRNIHNGCRTRSSCRRLVGC